MVRDAQVQTNEGKHRWSKCSINQTILSSETVGKEKPSHDSFRNALVGAELFQDGPKKPLKLH